MTENPRGTTRTSDIPRSYAIAAACQEKSLGDWPGSMRMSSPTGGPESTETTCG